MTNYKVLFLDIDGTILRPDDTIEHSTKESVLQVQQKGIEVFLATGRPLHEISDIGKELNIHSFIGYNGAFASYQGKEIINEPMDANHVEHFITTAGVHKHEIVMYTAEKNIVTSDKNPLVEDFIKKFHLRKNDLYTPEITNQVLGMTLINLKQGEVFLYEQKGIHLSQVNIDGMRHCYDIIRDHVNKGIAVHNILTYLNIPKEHSIAFGDGMNDKEMLQNVGESFAMGNGHPDLFAYAKHKTTDVTNSGIYNGLKQIGLVQ